MRLLRPVRLRLFLVVWAVCALHFATNVVREHYPAFALAAHASLRCDDWVVARADPAAPGGVKAEPLHPDLFRHDDPARGDGHWYANNNPGASLVAAPVLFVFEPLLAWLERVGKAQAAREEAGAGASAPAYSSEYPLRQKFMAEVRRRGLHLRLGAAAAITAVLVMAPAAALLALLVHAFLRRRGVDAARAVVLTLVFALATPLVFRSAILNHNQLEALVAFASFWLLAGGPGADPGPPLRAGRGDRPTAAAVRFGAAGMLAGATVLFDYSGVVLLGALFLFAIVVARRLHAAPKASDATRGASRSILAFAGASLVPLGLLSFTQWWQFGDPFRPAQHWMPDAHFSVRGYRGFAPPSLDLLARNLFDPSYGLFAFAPLLLLALVPPRAAQDASPASPAPRGSPVPRVLVPPERAFVLLLAAAFLLFCAANQFTRLQWNTGFRALAPLVPFLFLAASDGLVRLSPRAIALVAAPFALHSWVIAMARATPPLAPSGFADSTIARSWRAFLEHGLELPWLTVWRQTQPGGGPAWLGAVAPALVIATVALLALLWRAGARPAAGAPA